ncbi:M56 family metallopeptidase [Blautia faecis]|jgi:beta-lactamase regulating signal transducer with metallopeptidase domain|uniref:M56 family metallopeptidase n=2 Tax=Clostridia TaxID=186801 RepID=UPI001D08E312|nr:M56 family metallopeptidase [Blautia faecis]MCB6580392.1 M56 family metallopeptidase [Blautia faecis]MCB7292376.1 M56 family metallopeptidase [Blautia faecis]
MSIAGTVPLIICLLLLLLQRKKFSYRLGRNLVFLSLAGYLIPFQVVKYLMPTDVLIRTDALANISYYINFDDKGAISYHGISLWMSDWILMIGLCWLFLISGFSVYEIIKYHRLTRKLKKITEKRTCFLPGIGDVEYRISPLIGSPYTIGFLKPFIVAPESLEDSRLSEMIMRHEYSHLRRHDSAVKLLCLLAICLHFYNPLTLLTLLLYTSFSENIADQAATEGFTTEERKAYAVALVNLSARNRQVPVVWKNNLLGAKHTMKRRVEFIMMKNRKASKIGTAAAILASVFLSGTTVFGYAPMQTTEAADSVQLNETVSFVDSASNNPFANSNIYFETDEHVNILVNDSDLEPRAIICTHDFKSGYADVHNSKSNGGCVVKTYTAKICQKCNHLVIMDYVGTRTYAKCPHK